MLSAYDCGYAAYFEGDAVADNPFEGDDRERWEIGWRLGMQDYWNHGVDLEISIDPFHHGHEAFFRSRGYAANPHPVDSIQGRDWTRGWDVAEDLADEIDAFENTPCVLAF